MIEFQYYFLIHWGIIVVLEKYNYRDLVAKLGVKTNMRLFYEVSECLFCLNHHVGAVVAALFGLWCGYTWEMLLFPFMSASLMNIIQSINASKI